MRVLEAKPTFNHKMVKHKAKFRKQSKDLELCPGSDSSDEGGSQTGPPLCPHLNKAVNLNSVKKLIKQTGCSGECSGCMKAGKSSTERVTNDTEEDSLFDGMEPTIWLCLQCGHQGCDRNSKDRHALKHYSTPRSFSHAIVVNLTTWAVWCYDCDDELNPGASKKLNECLDYVRKQAGLPAVASGSKKSSGKQPAVNGTATVIDSKQDGAVEKQKVEQQNKTKHQLGLLSLPKVKGLSNLGNTCFFNAVMQSLSQTPMLESFTTNEQTRKSHPLHLPGGVVHDSDADDSDEDREGNKSKELQPLSITINESGALTQSLGSFLKDMNSVGKNNVVTPSSLFGQVCKKTPRFKGFQQQDSHELLRHLLDGMKAEEIHRTRGGILKAFNLKPNIDPKKVDDDIKLKAKEYGKQAKHTFVDSLFGGMFISTVQCEECKTPSQILEPFLDISLPITEEKVVRPNSAAWNKKSQPKEEQDDDLLDAYKDKPKKAAKLGTRKGKKGGKQGKKGKPNASGKAPLAVEEDNKVEVDEVAEDAMDTLSADTKVPDKRSDKDDTDSTKANPSDTNDDISDADIEDNIESDVSRNRFQALDSLSLHSNKSIDEDKPDVHNTSLCNGVDCDKITPVTSKHDTSGAESNKSQIEISKHAPGNSKSGMDNNAAASNSTVNCSTKLTSDMNPGGSSNKLTSDVNPGGSKCSSDTSPSDISDPSTRTLVNNCMSETINEVSSKLDKLHIGDGCHNASIECAESKDCKKTEEEKTKNSRHSKRPGSAEYRLQLQLKAMSSLTEKYHALSRECSVESCLNQFTSAELLTGNNKFGCRHCTKKKHAKHSGEGKKETVYTNANKQVMIFAPPAVLTLHLKRFQQVGFSLRKVNRHVEFPLILDLAPYCSALSMGVKSGQAKVLYSLYGIVEHSGRLSGGHYTAYVKVRPKNSKHKDFLLKSDLSRNRVDKVLTELSNLSNNGVAHEGTSSSGEEGGSEGGAGTGKWYYISDSRVSESQESSVLRCQAYLLFYERIY